MNDTWGIIAGYLIDEYEVDRLVGEPELLRFADEQIVRGKLAGLYQLACDSKYVETMKWLISKYEELPDAEYFFNRVCLSGQLEIAQLMFNRYNELKNITCQSYIFSRVCDEGYLPMAKWLVAQFKITAANIGFTTAFLTGDPLVVEWLTSEFAADLDLMKWV